MSSIRTSAINDPLRPRLPNASSVQVSPQRLAARFEPHAGDVMGLAARVNRAQAAAAAKALSENSMRIRLIRTTMSMMPSLLIYPLLCNLQLTEHLLKLQSPCASGPQALEYMKRTSITGTQPNHSYVIGVMLSLVPLAISDPHLFRVHRGHVQSCEALFIEWEKAEAHKHMVQRFVKEFREMNSQKLTRSMEMFHEYLIEVKKTSAQSAVTAMIYHSTFERRSFNANI